MFETGLRFYGWDKNEPIENTGSYQRASELYVDKVYSSSFYWALIKCLLGLDHWRWRLSIWFKNFLHFSEEQKTLISSGVLDLHWETPRSKSTLWNNFCVHIIEPQSFSLNLIQQSQLWTHKVLKPFCSLVIIRSYLFHSWRQWEVNDSSRLHGDLPAHLGARVCWFWTFLDDPISSHRVLSTLLWNVGKCCRKIKHQPSARRSCDLRRQDVLEDQHRRTVFCGLSCLHLQFNITLYPGFSETLLHFSLYFKELHLFS